MNPYIREPSGSRFLLPRGDAGEMLLCAPKKFPVTLIDQPVPEVGFA